MIRLSDTNLPEATLKKLASLQQTVIDAGAYPQQVEVAKNLFSRENKPDKPTFKHVRLTLTEMCSGARRCCYCEDSCADEVEHIWPKALYPERTFIWENYLYACGLCNGTHKKNRFKVFSALDGQVVDVTRPYKASVEPPVSGTPLLIDPRTEDPFEYIKLDLLGTFLFDAIEEPGSHSYLRAKYTIDLVGLNRGMLIDARREAYDSYRARLVEYI